MRLPVRLLAPVLVLALVATGCADDDEATTGQAPTTSPGQPVRGGTLVVAIDSDPGSLNPAVTSNGGVHTAAEPMFNGLVGLDNENKPVGELAERWVVEEDGAVYRFTLRDGLKWHDG